MIIAVGISFLGCRSSPFIESCCHQNNQNGAREIGQIAIGRNSPAGVASATQIERVDDKDTYRVSSDWIQLPRFNSELVELGYKKTTYICIVRFITPSRWALLSLTSSGPTTIATQTRPDSPNTPTASIQNTESIKAWIDGNTAGIAAFEEGKYGIAQEHFEATYERLWQELPQRTNGDDISSFPLAKVSNNRGEVMMIQKQYQKAAQLFRAAERTFNQKDDLSAGAMANKLSILEGKIEEGTHNQSGGLLYLEYERALGYFERSKNISMGSTADVIPQIKDLGNLRFHCGLYQENPRNYEDERPACTELAHAYDQAIQSISIRFGGDHELLAPLLFDYAASCRRIGETAKADDLLGRANAIMSGHRMMR